jgi:hypothetical protein
MLAFSPTRRTVNVAWGLPMRSTIPSNIRELRGAGSEIVLGISNTAKRMLDEPPLIVKMRGAGGFKVTLTAALE